MLHWYRHIDWNVQHCTFTAVLSREKRSLVKTGHMARRTCLTDVSEDCLSPAGGVEGRAEKGKQICEAFQCYFCLPFSVVHDSQVYPVTHGCPSQLCSDAQNGEYSKPRAEWRPRQIEPDKSVSLTLLVYVWCHTDRPCKDSLAEKLNYRMRKEKKRKKKLQYGTVRLCRNDAP